MSDETHRADAGSGSAEADRRGFLKHASRAAMAAGLVGGYGGFAAVAARYLYPARTGEVMWQFVTDVGGIEVGASIRYRGPSGETINIARQARTGAASDFIALSSTCPHLGCQVRWEGPNNRFHCPCHNGMFDPSGKAISGPPAEAGQSLPRYQLRVERGMLHIAVPPPGLTEGARGADAGVLAVGTAPEGPGHDPCLAPDARPRAARRDPDA